MSAVTILIGFVGNDMALEVSSLRDSLANPNNDPNGDFLNSLVTVNLDNVVDGDGTQLGAPAAFPLNLPYVATSNGIYRATIPDDWPFLEGVRYKFSVSADGGAGLKGAWVLTVDYQTREE